MKTSLVTPRHVTFECWKQGVYITRLTKLKINQKVWFFFVCTTFDVFTHSLIQFLWKVEKLSVSILLVKSRITSPTSTNCIHYSSSYPSCCKYVHRWLLRAKYRQIQVLQRTASNEFLKKLHFNWGTFICNAHSAFIKRGFESNLLGCITIFLKPRCNIFVAAGNEKKNVCQFKLLGRFRFFFISLISTSNILKFKLDKKANIHHSNLSNFQY